MTKKKQNENKPNADNMNGHITIPIIGGFPDFDKVMGQVGETPEDKKDLSWEQCMAIISIGHQYMQSKVTSRQVLLMDNEKTKQGAAP